MSRQADAMLVTPRGVSGGIATVWVVGPDALALVSGIFRPRSGGALGEGSIGRARLGWIRMPDFEGGGPASTVPAAEVPAAEVPEAEALVDEVIVAVVASGDSPPVVAIHGHGGRAITRRVLDALERAGGRVLDRDARFEVAAAPDADPIGRRALAALESARTLRAAEMLAAQVAGALSRELARIGASLAPEAVESDSNAGTAVERLEEADRALGHLEARARLGSALVDGVVVALAGAPNAGKSSLFNALLRYDRVVTSEFPGTTRDAIDAWLEWNGIPVRLVDTPGIDRFGDPVLDGGVAKARETLASADLVLLLADGSASPTEADQRARAAVSGRDRAVSPAVADGKAGDEGSARGPSPLLLGVRTKSDLGSAGDGFPVDPSLESVGVSARTGEGLDRLISRAIGVLGFDAPDDPSASGPGDPGREAVPFTPEQVAGIRKTRFACRALLERARRGASLPGSAWGTLGAMLADVEPASPGARQS